MSDSENNPSEPLSNATPDLKLVTKLPRKPAAVMTVVDIIDDELIDSLKAQFGNAILAAKTIGGQQVLEVDKTQVKAILTYLFSETMPNFNMLTDLTAIHTPDKESPLEIVYQLYTLPGYRRLRIKTSLKEGEAIDTVTDIWATANWLEREVYDLFGVLFREHPDLRRILLPRGWVGHPLRKEYPLEYQDNEWASQNLQIRDLPANHDYTGKFE